MSANYVPKDPHVAEAQKIAQAGGACMAITVKVKEDGTYIVASYGETKGLCGEAKRIADKIAAVLVAHYTQ